MLYELRIYDAVAGRLPDISGRFANHTCALFRKHGVKYLDSGPTKLAGATG